MGNKTIYDPICELADMIPDYGDREEEYNEIMDEPIYVRLIKKQANVVYFIYSVDEELLYIGQSVDFYGRLYKHLFWKDSKFKNIDIGYVKIYVCKTKADMDLTEDYFIKKYKPKMNDRRKRNDDLTFDISSIEKQENYYFDIFELTDTFNFIKISLQLALPEEYAKLKDRWRSF